MHSSTKQFTDFLDADGIRYQCAEDATANHHDIVVLSYKCENIPRVIVKFFFDENCENVSIRAFDLVKFPEDKLTAMLAAVNSLNNKFSYMKFVIDTDDHTVQGELDACFREHDVGEICAELLRRSVDICDRACPDLMKAAWS